MIGLLDNDVSFYEVHNNGNWYNVGFALGAGLWMGAGRGAPAAGKRRRGSGD